eukprot:SAG31_NODE_5643_length_2407_cov_1.866551_3_plen_66_part_00
MTEGIDLPGTARNRGFTKILSQELVPAGGLIYHLHIELQTATAATKAFRLSEWQASVYLWQVAGN